MNNTINKGVLLWCITLLLFLLPAGGCEQENVPPPQVEKKPENTGTIVAVGDSLTAGLGVAEMESYPAMLEKKLQNSGYAYKVFNAGVSGETTSGLHSRLEWIMTMKPDIVIVESGANDGLRGIDVSVPKKNLRAIVEFFQEQGVIVVFTGMKMVWNLGQDYTSAFNAIYPEVAAEFDLIFMPFFLADVATVRDLNSEDGIHPNGDGYAKIVDNLYPYVIKAIQELKKAER